MEMECKACMDQRYTPCKSCLQTGKMSCPTCRGTPKTCPQCSGKKSIPSKLLPSGLFKCGACEGSGFRMCVECKNIQKTPCSMCNGHKSTKCVVCEGTGMGTNICLICNGNKRFACDKCNNSPLRKGCHSCRTVGTKACRECEGKGTRNCANCRGRGGVGCVGCNSLGVALFSCKGCKGGGSIRCKQCFGKGLYAVGGGRGDIIYDICTYCQGVGASICRECGTLGRVDCTQCHMQFITICPHCVSQVIHEHSFPIPHCKFTTYIYKSQTEYMKGDYVGAANYTELHMFEPAGQGIFNVDKEDLHFPGYTLEGIFNQGIFEEGVVDTHQEKGAKLSGRFGLGLTLNCENGEMVVGEEEILTGEFNNGVFIAGIYILYIYIYIL